MKETMRDFQTGEPVQIEVFDLGLKSFKGHPYYTTRFVLPNRKRAVISRVPKDMALIAANMNEFRMAEDLAVLEGAGVTY